MANGKFRGVKQSASRSSASGLWNVSEVHQNVLAETWTGLPVEVGFLVIAGGGGGITPNTGTTGAAGAGGGAGGYRTSEGTSGGNSPAEEKLLLPLGTYSLSIGAGGLGGDGQPDWYNFHTNGGPSVFASVTSLGGGVGTLSGPASGVGSGGGAVDGAATLGTPGQGSDGGGPFGGSGGGAGGPGLAGGTYNTNSSKNGGPGLASSITGSSIIRGGGGANGFGSGGTGGGGNPNTSGQINTGGGGGGIPGGADRSGGNGGSGIVIFTVPAGTPVSFSGGVTEANGGAGQPVGDNTVYTVTAAGPADEVTIG